MQSLKMSISDEKEFHWEILITPIFNICASPHVLPTCDFCQSLDDRQTIVLIGLVVSYLHT